MRKHGEKRVDYVCKGCETEVLETWQDINGGYWQRTLHEPENCLKVLLDRIKTLESVVARLAVGLDKEGV